MLGHWHSNAPNSRHQDHVVHSWDQCGFGISCTFHILWKYIHYWCKPILSLCNEFTTPIRTNQRMATLGWKGGGVEVDHAEKRGEKQTCTCIYQYRIGAHDVVELYRVLICDDEPWKAVLLSCDSQNKTPVSLIKEPLNCLLPIQRKEFFF